jgi:hypothetical protein
MKEIFSANCDYCGREVKCKVKERRLIAWAPYCSCYEKKYGFGAHITVTAPYDLGMRVLAHLESIREPDWEV